MSTCQMWLQAMKHSLVILLFCEFLKIINNYSCLKWLYLHQTFTNYVSDCYSQFFMSICHMWLQIMERYLILMRFREFSYITKCLKCCIITKLSHTVCLIVIHNSVCKYTRCDCRLWKVIWFKYVWIRNFRIFLQISNVISS